MSGLTDAIVLGAGSGTRYAQGQTDSASDLTPKQFSLLNGKPVFIWSVEALLQSVPLRQIVIVVSPEYLSLTSRLVAQFLPQTICPIKIIVGGRQRQDSSYSGLLALEHLTPMAEFVWIHDACRPILSKSLLSRLNQITEKIPEASGWIPALPVTDTLKRVQGHQVLETVDRTPLVRVQTPQVFRLNKLLTCFKNLAEEPPQVFTDDAAILEHFKEPIVTLQGDDKNIKLTYASDLDLAQKYLLATERTRLCVSESVTTSTA